MQSWYDPSLSVCPIPVEYELHIFQGVIFGRETYLFWKEPPVLIRFILTGKKEQAAILYGIKPLDVKVAQLECLSSLDYFLQVVVAAE